MNNFLPSGYNPPKSNSHYFKFADGDNLFRILAPVVMGWEDWTEDKKPVRFKYDEKPEAPINPKRAIKHFWVFPIWDYKEKAVKILEITQSSIQQAIFNLHNDEDWGNPMGYDIKVKREGKDLDTTYSVNPKPKTPISPEIKAEFLRVNPNLEALFKGEDPFASQAPTKEVKTTDEEMEIPLSEIPF